MNQPDTIVVRAPDRPAQMVSAKSLGLPPDRLGIPVHYFWRPMVEAKKYAHPDPKWDEISFSPGELSAAAQHTKEMIRDGAKPYLPLGHKGKDNNQGFIWDAKFDGQTLWGLHGFIGQSAVENAARNETSICLRRNWRGGNGKTYPVVVEHNALVADPVAMGLGDYVALSRGSDGPAEEVPIYSAVERNAPMVSDDQLFKVRTLLGDDTLTAENAFDTMLAATNAALSDVTDRDVQMSRLIEERDQLNANLSAAESARDEAIQMSRDAHLPIETPAELTDVYLSRSERILEMVQNGQLTPNRAKRLRKLCKGDRGLSVVMLSRDAATNALPIDTLLDFVAGTPELRLGEDSNAQALTMSRPDPGGEPPSPPLPYERMAAKWNGKNGPPQPAAAS